MLKIFYSSKWFPTPQKYDEWLSKNKEKLDSYLFLSSLKFDYSSNNAYEFYERFNTVFKIRLLDNFAFGYDYLEKISFFLTLIGHNKKHQNKYTSIYQPLTLL